MNQPKYGLTRTRAHATRLRLAPVPRRRGRPKDVRSLAKGDQALTGEKPGRNDPCPCESGLKFKRCCA